MKSEKLIFYYNIIFILLFLAGIFSTWKNGIQDIQNFEKHFSGRITLINALSYTRFHFLGDTIFSSVIVNRQNAQPWLIYTGEMSLDDYQNTIPFTTEQLSTIQSKLDSLDLHLSEKNIKFYLVIAPNKNTIYPENFPSEIPMIGEESRLDQLMEYQENYGQVRIIDLREALFAAKQTGPVFFATGSHWNEYGAWAGYYQIAKNLETDFPEIRPHGINDYEQNTNVFNAMDLSNMMGKLNIPEETIILQPNYISQVSSYNTNIEGKDFFITTQPDSDLPTAVIFRDSFSTALIPYLSEHFSRVVYVWSNEYDENLIEEENPDIVIMECTERYIHSLLYLP